MLGRSNNILSFFIFAIEVFCLLLSANRVQAQVPEQPDNTHGLAANGSTFVLPSLTGPQLPPPPPTLTTPEIPSPFLGCWQGDPGKFDTVQTDVGLVDIGSPGRIVFCYDEHTVELPEAQVRIHPGARAIDWLMHFGLGFSTYNAHGLHTDIYAISPVNIHGRTTLALTQTEHWLYVIPSRHEQPSEVDWIVTLIRPDTALIEASQVIYDKDFRMWGTWHGTFHRMAENHDP